MKIFLDCSLFSAKGIMVDSPLRRNYVLYVTLDDHLFFAEKELPVGWFFPETGEINIIFKHCNDMGKYLAICFKDDYWRIYDKKTHGACFFTSKSGEKVYIFRLKAHHNSKMFIAYDGDKNDGWFDTENLMETTKT